MSLWFDSQKLLSPPLSPEKPSKIVCSTGMVKGAHPFPLSKVIGRCKVKEPSDCSFLSLIFGSQVLLHYPLDGRLTTSPLAETNCKMDEIGDITKPDLETLEKLVYDVVDTKNILEVPPVTAQVTKWRVCSSTLYESLYVRWYWSYGVR
ncbi:unnamed protein product [Brassica oleracea]|nr:unnamed protein product [Brassica napus]